MAEQNQVSTKVSKKKLSRFPLFDFAQISKDWSYYLNILSGAFKKIARRFLSIDFGQAFVKIAYVESKKDNLILLNYDLKKILSTQENRQEIVDFINNFLKINSITEKELYLTISDIDSIAIKYTTLPLIPKKEIKDALKWQVKEEITFDLEGALFDWQIYKEYTDKEGAKKIEVVFAAAKKEIIDKYLSIVRDCDLHPARISAAPFNYGNLLTRIETDRSQVQSILDIGYEQAILCIYMNNKLNFIRPLPFSSDKLTRSLTSTLFSDKGSFKLSYEKAEEIKEGLGIPKDDLILEGNISSTQIRSLMRFFLEGLVRELMRSLDYFKSNFQVQNPSTLYITGGGGSLKNLDEYLSKELNINVYKLPIPGCIDTGAIPREELDKSQNQIMSALGAALAEVRAINLLPREIKTQRIEFIERASLRLIATTIGAILLFSFFFVQLQMRDYKDRLKLSQIHLETIKEIKVLKQNTDLKENLIDKIQEGRIPVDGLLKVIGALIPHNIILDELLLGQDKHILILRGTASGGPDVSTSVINFIEEIETSSFFIEAQLVSSKRVGAVQKFEIHCDLAH